MQILRLLAARRAAREAGEDDEGPFFDLDFSSCSVRASSYSSGSLSLSDSDSEDECTELDFIISLQRSSSASPLKFCASEPPTRANSLPSKRHGDRKRAITLRTFSFGARKAAPLYGRHTFPRSSSGRYSFARSSTSSARSFRLFADAPDAAEDDGHHAKELTSRRAPSRDVIRRCLAKISRRIRTATSPRAGAAVEVKGLRRLRKCRSASSAPPAPRRDDDSAVEKQDGIAGAIAHCIESLHRVENAASVSECDSPLLRSRSDPGDCEAAEARRSSSCMAAILPR